MADTAKVLVVDDDPDIVETVKMVLESADMQVSTAASAAEAFERVDSFQPDVILLDVMMPEGTEGFHFVWKLRNQYPPEMAKVPIIILSAIHSTTDLRFYPDVSDGTYEPGEFLPVQDFIDKPAEPGVLISKIRKLLPS